MAMNMSSSVSVGSIPSNKHHQKQYWSFIVAATVFLVLIVATLFTFSASLGTQSSTVETSISHAVPLIPTPSPTPSTAREYFDREWNRPSIQGYPTTIWWVTRSFLNFANAVSILFIIGLLASVVLLIVTKLFPAFLDTSSPKELAQNSFIDSVLFLFIAGYTSIYDQLLHIRNRVLPPIKFVTTICLVLGILLGLLSFGIVANERGILSQVIMLVTLAGFFPLSYVAYNLNTRRRNTSIREGDGQDITVSSLQPADTNQPITIERLALDFLLSAPGADPVDMTDPKNPKPKYEIIEIYMAKAKRYYDKFYSSTEYFFYLIIVVLLTIIGVSLFYWDAPANSAILKSETISAIRFGFLGSYIFSIQLIYRRYTTDDLLPSVYMYSAQAILAGAMFNYTAFQAIITLAANDSQKVGVGLIAIISFALGYFPLLAIRWFNRLSYQALEVRRNPSEQMSLDLIDGISTFHEARLRDLGIDNMENLASFELHKLITTTPFSSQQIVDWIDQAILYMSLSSGEIEIFRGSSIRTASDFWNQWKATLDAPQSPAPTVQGQNIPVSQNQAQKTLSLQLQTTPERLEALYISTQKGPNGEMVKSYWKRKPYEGVIAVALDPNRKLQLILSEIVSQYHSALEFAGNPSNDTARKSAVDAALQLRERYIQRTDVAPPDPTSDEGKKGLMALKLALYQNEVLTS